MKRKEKSRPLCYQGMGQTEKRHGRATISDYHFTTNTPATQAVLRR